LVIVSVSRLRIPPPNAKQGRKRLRNLFGAYSDDVISAFRRDVNSHWTKPLRGMA
jgi:hypothetical protein